jgi:hypothetical protein
MAGNILLEYIAATSMTVTALHTIDTSATYIAGWSSDSVDNGTNEYEDYLISATFTSAASNRQPGQIYMYAYSNLGETAFSAGTPDLFSAGTEGSEGAVTVYDTYRRDCGMRLLWACSTDSTASAVYVMPATSLASAFGGWVPDQWALFVTSDISSSGDVFASGGGSAIYYVPVHHRYT